MIRIRPSMVMGTILEATEKTAYVPAREKTVMSSVTKAATSYNKKTKISQKNS